MSNTNPDIIAGIDLGTTNSAIAVLENGVPRLIAIDGQPTMPSCVGLDESGKILVGQPAINQIAAAPERTITSIKRQMGSDVSIKLGDKEYRPEEISAFILKRLKEEAESDLGCPVTKAVITVPAYFDENQRRATQNAAELAGLEAVRILNEPTAAALAYNLQNKNTQTILVYDLGGGTFDVSLVNCEKELVEVRASHGDTHLGGDDFDQLLVDHLAKAWTGAKPLDLNDPSVSRRLKMAAETAKCQLSDQPFSVVHEDYLADDTHLEIEISRQDFEELIAPMLEKTWESIHAALHDSKVDSQNVDKILLVGGSTRIPLVQKMIEQRVGRTPSREVDPDLVVTMGAAIQGGIIAGQEVAAVLVDISTHTFSTEALEGYMDMVCVPIIPRGTPLPVVRSEAFYTVHDRQEAVQVHVYQGESRLPEENLEIGQFTIEGLSPVPSGNVIISQFALDLNGMLEVTAIEKSTCLAKVVQIDTRDIETSFDLAEARQRMSESFGEEAEAPAAIEAEATTEPDKDHTELIRAKDIKKRAEKLLEGDIDTEDADDIKQLLTRSRDAVKSGQHAELNEISTQLEDIIFYLEE